MATRFRLAFLLMVSLCLSISISAQKVSGKITSNGEPLTGASVLVKGSTTGVITDLDGNFSIEASPNATLVVSFVGYKNTEVAVGNQTIINITLEEESSSLSELVVTALGIKKDAKKLGYATSTVSAEQLTENRTPNFINSLSGKVAGVNISGLGTGPTGTSKIRIRGQSSINGQNGPLIVVNGVPIDNTNFGYNPGNAGADNSTQVRGGGNTSDGGDG